MGGTSLQTRILDTNVLLDSPIDEVIKSYEPCEIVIPFVVLKELDTFKQSSFEPIRRNARYASRFIDKLRKHGANLHEGIELESSHILSIELNHLNVSIPVELDPHDVDDRILKVAKGLQDDGKDVIICTQDVNQRIIADVLGIPAEDYGEIVDIKNLYKGWNVLPVSGDKIDEFAEEGTLKTRKKLYYNEFVILTSLTNPKHTMLARYDGERLVKLYNHERYAYGIKALNVQQKFLMELLFDPNVKLVTAIGGAGTGKSLLALASGIEQTEVIGTTKTYNKMFVSRSPEPMGKEHGYLPGGEQEKISPWLGGMFDNLEFLVESHASGKSGKADNPQEAIQSLIDFGRIDLKALTYIRGRSIPRQFIVIDEAQNLSKHEIKTIVSRAGNNTKVIIIGDIEQIDNPRLDMSNNGLVHLVEAFKGQRLHGHITLIKTERGELSDLAVKLL